MVPAPDAACRVECIYSIVREERQIIVSLDSRNLSWRAELGESRYLPRQSSHGKQFLLLWFMIEIRARRLNRSFRRTFLGLGVASTSDGGLKAHWLIMCSPRDVLAVIKSFEGL